MLYDLHPVLTQFDEWRRIVAFPDYSVSSTGLVRNDKTGRRLVMLVNQSGIVNVGLTLERKQYKRAVALLVAKAFLAVTLQDAFDTPINLDGDRYNNWIGNLMLRPRWFATKYFQQFHEEAVEDYPIEDVDSGEIYDTTWQAATTLGLLHSDIILSVHTGKRVWPTNQRFRPLA